jgi:hypothetical protein
MSGMHALALAVALASALTPAALGGTGGDAGTTKSAKGREPVGALVKRCVEAYGGKAAFARSALRREFGTVTSLLHPGDVGEIARAYSRPGRLRVEIAYPGGGGEIRVLDGARGWRDGEEASGPRLQAMVLQAARLDVVAMLAAPTTKVAERGGSTVNGVVVRVLAFEPAPGLTVEAHVDPRTGRILRTRGSAGGPNVPVAFETTYGDFKKVDGVLVALHEWNWANGKSTGETVLKEVEFPKTLPPETWAP